MLTPVLITVIVTLIVVGLLLYLIGLIPMALKLGEGSEAYAPLARSIIGGLAVSVVLTLFIVPSAYLFIYQRREVDRPATPEVPKNNLALNI